VKPAEGNRGDPGVRGGLTRVVPSVLKHGPGSPRQWRA